MSTLLSLPQELRDHIIDYMLLHTPQAPLHAASEFALRAPLPRTHNNTDNDAIIASRVLYPISTSTYHDRTACNLFLTCRRLRTEILGRTKRLGLAPLLDVMIADELYIWATWLRSPLFSGTRDKEENKIPRLDVQIRIAGAYPANETLRSGYKNLVNEHQSLFFYVICKLLERALMASRTATANPETHPALRLRFNHTIKTLNVNISTAVQLPPNCQVASCTVMPHWALFNRQIRGIWSDLPLLVANPRAVLRW